MTSLFAHGRVSKEEDLEEGHTIVPDGYDIGRNLLVENALGTTSFNGVTYSTTAQNITGLMLPGSVGVNHGEYQCASTRFGRLTLP